MKTATRVVILIFISAAIVLLPNQVEAISFDVEKAYKSVVVVSCDNGSGSGFAVSPNCVITNSHVVGRSLTAEISSYSGEISEVAVIANDSVTDLAVLMVSDISLEPMKFTSSDSVSIGDDVYAIGAPFGLSFSMTKGILSARSRMIDSQSFLQIDAPVNSGNSGGPLLNHDGLVIGINTLKLSAGEGIGLSIPSELIFRFLTANGISFERLGGNTAGETIIPEKPSLATSAAEESNAQQNGKETPYVDTGDISEGDTPSGYFFHIALGVSLLINLLLGFVLLRTKKKLKKMANERMDSQDFEIELLE